MPSQKRSRGGAPLYKAYALKYAGPLPRKMAMMRWLQGFDVDTQCYYYIWAVVAEDGETLLYDTGTSPAFGRDMVDRYRITNYVDPREIVGQLGVDPASVTRVVVSHCHFDHVGGMTTFPETYPNAKFYIQKREYDFWIRNPLAKRLPFAFVSDPEAFTALAALEGSDRLEIVDGDKRIAPGLTLLLAPGHSPGLQCVSVNAEGGAVILASDCAHVAQSFRDDIPSCLIFNMEIWMSSFDKLRSLVPVERLFPGHDMCMMDDYPHVSPDVTRLA